MMKNMKLLVILVFSLMLLLANVFPSIAQSDTEKRKIANEFSDKGRSAAERGNYREAIEHFTVAITSRPDGFFYEDRGDAKFKLKDFQLTPNSEQKLSLEEMVRKYGGSYSVDCRKSSSYQANITVDALTLKLGSKQIRGANPSLGGLLPKYKYITTDPSLKAAFSADVARNVRMSFTVYDDKDGLYLLVIGHPKIEDAVQVDKEADERPVFRKCR
jgi:tetratricopeptide (TPR) repeat protein